MRSPLWALLAVFSPLSLVTVGGGQTVVADIQRQVVDVHHWLTATAFLDDFAISRMAPGPGSLLATLIGWQVAGVAGAVVATIGIFGPTALLMIGVAHLWSRHGGRRWQVALETGLRPVAGGAILAAVTVLIRTLDGGWAARAIAVASGLVLLRSRVNPLVLLAGGAVVLLGLQAAGLGGG